MNISVENLSKSFNETLAVQNLSFNVPTGKIVGLLGPNGAGKTTTLRMILNILKPDEGEITFDGSRLNSQLRSQIGYLPEERGIYQQYRVVDVMVYMARLKNMTRRKSYIEAVRLLDRFQMIEQLEEKVGSLSRGRQQILQYLLAILHDPKILILDEPFAGLDPVNQEKIRENLIAKKEEGYAILLSTHQLETAETLCDYFIMVNHGQCVLKGTLGQIRKNYNQNSILVESTEDLSILREIKQVKKVSVGNGQARLFINRETKLNHLLEEIINTVPVSKLEINRPSLKDIFLEATKPTEQV